MKGNCIFSRYFILIIQSWKKFSGTLLNPMSCISTPDSYPHSSSLYLQWCNLAYSLANRANPIQLVNVIALKKSYMRVTGVLIGVLMSLTQLGAQTYRSVDSIPTHENIRHLFMRINSPTGDVSVSSSKTCGYVFSEFISREENLKHDVDSKKDPTGNIHLTFSVKKEDTPPTFNARMAFAKGLITEEVKSYKLAYLNDPNIPTNLWLSLGSGNSELDLSYMTLNNLRVQSALSDINITYNGLNRTMMQKMDLHAASADINLKNLEQAKAEVINIRNDVGSTQLSIGKKYFPQTNVHVMTGTGGCKIYVHPEHPVKIILKTGIFGQARFSGSFEETSSNVYVNNAYKANKHKPCVVICETDIGVIYIQEVK